MVLSHPVISFTVFPAATAELLGVERKSLVSREYGKALISLLSSVIMMTFAIATTST